MKLRFFKKKRKLRVTITKDEILDQVIKLNWMLDEKIKQLEKIQKVQLEVVIYSITIKGTNMKYKVTRSDFPIKVKLRPEDEQNNLVGILKGSAGFSTDVAGVVSLTQDPTDEEAAVMDFAGAGTVQVFTKSMSEDGQHKVTTVDTFIVTENEETKAETGFTNAAGQLLVGTPDDVETPVTA
jgi:2-polyprenyl-3-methyl-5-hydroxy-6-metoxy-1,4-benzoquinol methylase